MLLPNQQSDMDYKSFSPLGTILKSTLKIEDLLVVLRWRLKIKRRNNIHHYTEILAIRCLQKILRKEYELKDRKAGKDIIIPTPCN